MSAEALSVPQAAIPAAAPPLLGRMGLLRRLAREKVAAAAALFLGAIIIARNKHRIGPQFHDRFEGQKSTGAQTRPRSLECQRRVLLDHRQEAPLGSALWNVERHAPPRALGQPGGQKLGLRGQRRNLDLRRRGARDEWLAGDSSSRGDK